MICLKNREFDFTMGFGSLNMRLKELFLHARIPFRDGLVVCLVHPPTTKPSPKGILACRKDSFSRVQTAKSHSKTKFSLFQTYNSHDSRPKKCCEEKVREPAIRVKDRDMVVGNTFN